MDWLIDLWSENKTLMPIDSSENAHLLSMLDNSNGALHMVLTNLLEYTGTLNYKEPILLPDEGLKSGNARRPAPCDKSE